MTLTLHTAGRVVHIDITADQFARLRDPSVTADEISAIAAECKTDPDVLMEYTEDLKKSVQDMLEIDGSCDYSDHL